MRCCGGRRRRHTPPLRSTPGETGCSSAWRRSPSRPPRATTPPGAGSDAGGRRPVSFLGRPTAPPEECEPTQGSDDHRDQDDRDKIARGHRQCSPCEAALASAARCVGRSVAPGPPCRSDPRWSMWCSWPRRAAGSRRRGAGPLPVLDRVLTRCGAAAAGPGPGPGVVGVTARRRAGASWSSSPGRTIPGRRHLGRGIADLGVRGRTPGGGSLESPVRRSGTSSLLRRQPGWKPIVRRAVVGVGPRARGPCQYDQ